MQLLKAMKWGQNRWRLFLCCTVNILRTLQVEVLSKSKLIFKNNKFRWLKVAHFSTKTQINDQSWITGESWKRLYFILQIQIFQTVRRMNTFRSKNSIKSTVCNLMKVCSMLLSQTIAAIFKTLVLESVSIKERRLQPRVEPGPFVFFFRSLTTTLPHRLQGRI